MYGDAAALFSRIGEFGRAVEMAASSKGCQGGYMAAAKTQQVCGALVDAGRQQQAIDLARSVPEPVDAAPSFIIIAEHLARSGECAHAIALLDETAAGLLHVLSREAARQPRGPYVSDRGSLEHRSAMALNRVAAAYFRIGQVERAIGAMTHPMPDGADRNLISLRAQDSRVLAVQAAVAGDLKAARILLDCALVCAKAISPNLPHERAEMLGRIVVPELLVGRPATALSVWTTLEESKFDRASFLNACVQIGTDCGTLQAHMPGTLLTPICKAIDKA
jgi:hypothetical protein